MAFGQRATALVERAAPSLFTASWPDVLAATRRAVGRRGYVSHAELAAPLVAWSGAPDGCVAVLELLQVAIDLEDNLVDWDIDRLAQLPEHKRYDSPRDALHPVPALLVAIAIAELARLGPSGPHACALLCRVLDAMTAGQAAPEESAERVALASGEQGLLLCLPVWLMVHDPAIAAATRSVEDWARAFGATWELRERSDAYALQRAASRARFLWPELPPFLEPPLRAGDLLPRGMS